MQILMQTNSLVTLMTFMFLSRPYSVKQIIDLVQKQTKISIGPILY